MTRLAPWHDTPTCIEGIESGDPGKVCGGPLVPFSSGRPRHEVPNIHHIKCAACGCDRHETNRRVLACVWWSAGAYVGREHGYPEGVRDGGQQGHAEERDRVVAWLREWASVGRTDLYEMARELERGDHWKQTEKGAF